MTIFTSLNSEFYLLGLGFGGLFPLFPPEGFPVVLGPFGGLGLVTLAITKQFKINSFFIVGSELHFL